MKVSIFYITKNGHELALRIQSLFPDGEVIRYSSERMQTVWHQGTGIICIMATGIVVRTIAPLLKDKKTDPAVVVIDEKGEYVISLLSGHLGGANALTRMIADHLGSRAVITTASDVQGKTALDLWAVEKGLHVDDFEGLKRLSMKIVQDNRIRLYSVCSISKLPVDISLVDSADEADMIITEEIMDNDAVSLRPPNLFAGIGCNRGTSADEIEMFVRDTFKGRKLSLDSLRGIASIDLKKDEQGLNEFAERFNLHTWFYSTEVLNSIAREFHIYSSRAVQAATGATAVSEPAAIAAAQDTSNNYEVLIPKIKRGNVTLAITKAEYTL